VTIHYHGLPLTPDENLAFLAGRHFCLSYATARGRPTQVRKAIALGQSILWDNGAYSAKTKGVSFDEEGFYAWVAPNLGHPHWAVVPDVIDGTVAEQRPLVARWPFARELGAPVWHLGLPTDYLLELVDAWPKVCFGSAGNYWQIGSQVWRRRMDEAFDALLSRRRQLPWIHGLRMLGQVGCEWPLASADSVNVARNYKTARTCPGCMAHRIDQVNGPLYWLGSVFT